MVGEAAATGNDLVATPLGSMGNHPTLVKLLAVARHRLADIEARGRIERGSMNGYSPPESRRRLEALELRRLKAVLDVQRIQDQLSSLGEENDAGAK